MRASALLSVSGQLGLRVVIVVSQNAALCLIQRRSELKPLAPCLEIWKRQSQAVGLPRQRHCGGQVGRRSQDAERPDAAGCRSQAAQPPCVYEPLSAQTVCKGARLVITEAKRHWCRPRSRAERWRRRRSCAWRARSQPCIRFPVSLEGKGPRRTTASKNGCDPSLSRLALPMRSL